MEPDKASSTALATAHIRGAHFWDEIFPKVFEDSLAEALVSDEERENFDQGARTIVRRLVPELASLSDDELRRVIHRYDGLRAPVPLVLSRARFAEDSLEQAIERGVRQYVVIGAGMDTFALRRRDLSDRLNVFEIDFPATQALKRERIIEADLELPPNLYFAPADFEKDSVATMLRGLPFNPAEPAFFSWLGVVMYLTLPAFEATLHSVRSVAAPGSELVFDYFDEAYAVPEARDVAMQFMFENVASRGEPFQSFVKPSALAVCLAELGWQLVEELGPAEVKHRFFKERHEAPSAIGRLARARAI